MREGGIECEVVRGSSLECGKCRLRNIRCDENRHAIRDFRVVAFEGAFGHIRLAERVCVVARIPEKLEFGIEKRAKIGEHEFALRPHKRCAMSKFVPVAQVADIPSGESRAYVVGDREVAVFNVDGVFHAIENACPHQGGPLAEGWIEGNIVTCPWHAWCFDVTTGAMTLGGYTTVDAFDVALDGTTVTVASEPRL